MIFDEIKAALFDGALVRVVGIDYVDTYRIGTSHDGTSIRAYANDDVYSFGDMFADIDRALSRSGVRVFRREFTEGVMITIIIGIGDEVE